MERHTTKMCFVYVLDTFWIMFCTSSWEDDSFLSNLLHAKINKWHHNRTEPIETQIKLYLLIWTEQYQIKIDKHKTFIVLHYYLWHGRVIFHINYKTIFT